MEKHQISKTIGSAPAHEESQSVASAAELNTAPLTNMVAMCSKCCRKLGAEGKTLRKAIKAAIQDDYGSDVQLEKTDCFSLCPKGGQVLSTSPKHQPRRIVIVEPGSQIGRSIDYLLS
jgi:hypothetical protein